MKHLKPRQIGVCSWSLQPQSIDQLIDLVHATGLSQIQLALNPLASRDKARWARAKTKLARARIRVGSGMFAAFGEDYSSLESIRVTGGFDPDENWERNLKAIKAIIPVAKKFGVKLVSCHAGFIPADAANPGFAKLLARVAQVARLFAKANITLLLETGQETADTLLRFFRGLKKAGVKNVGVNFDPANMILYGQGDPVAALKKLLPHVRQVHIKDALFTANPGAWGTEVPVGKGMVDWPAFLRLLDNKKFRGSLMIEREAGDNRAGDIKSALEFLQKLLAE